MVVPDFRIIGLKILWCITNKKEYLAEFASLIDPNFFGSAAERYLVTWAIQHYKTHAEIMTEGALAQLLETNADDLKSASLEPDDIWDIYDNTEPLNEKEEDKYIKNMTRLFVKHRGLYMALQESQQVLKEQGPDEAWALLERARARTSVMEARNVKLIGDIRSALQRIGDRENEVDFISTGIGKLDDFMDGGLRTGEVAVFLAPTGRGKTMWLCQTGAMGLSMGIDVVYYTLEVDRDEIWLRMMASASGVQINDLRKYAAASDGDPEYQRMRNSKYSPMKRLEELQERLKRTGNSDRDVLIRDIAIRGATLDNIFADFERIKHEGYSPSLMVIDYADRLRSKGRHDTEHEAQHEIYTELQAAAKEFDIGIWTATQTNRAGLDKPNLTLNEIQGAFAKAFEATYVLAAGQTPRMQKENTFKFIMAKARRSSAAGRSFLVKYDLSKARFMATERRLSDEDADLADDYAEARSYQPEETDDEREEREERERTEERSIRRRKKYD